MTEQELKDRIDSLYGQQIEIMSDESLRKLTSNFKESLVRRVVAIGSTLEEQEIIIDKIDDTLKTFYRYKYGNLPEWITNGIEVVKNIRFDLECGIQIKNDDEKNDFEKWIEEINNQTITNEADSNESPKLTVSDQQEIPNPIMQDASIIESDVNTELDACKKENEDLKDEVEYLKNEGRKLSSKQAAILTITACYYGGGLPSNRENLYPILVNLFGIGETFAKRRLREGVKQNDADELAKCFNDTAPKIARLIREMPEKLKNNK